MKATISKKKKTVNVINDVLCPVIFNGREFYGIKEFDCISVNLFTEKTLQGEFFTCIPISPVNYRKTNPTQAKVTIKKEKNWTIFKVCSDWGELYEMKIHNNLSSEIRSATVKAFEYGLL